MTSTVGPKVASNSPSHTTKSAAGGSARSNSWRRRVRLRRRALVLVLVVVIVFVACVVVRVLRRGPAPLLHQPPGLDRLRHVLRLLAVDRTVLELDHRVLPLPGQLLDFVAVARPGVRNDDVIDPGLVERLLDAPARMAAELRPEVAAPVQLDRHRTSLRLER